jgi:Carboxypeptidase regulatory-like domain
MKKSLQLTLAFCMLVVFNAFAFGQVTGESTASISGRISINGKGAAGFTVTASTTTTLEVKASGKAITDDDGNYRITGLPPGRFTVTPVAKAYAMPSTGMPRNQPGRSVNVAAGEEITKIDFALVRGGVITGRITDADGSPIIGEHVSILLSGSQTSEYVVTTFEDFRSQTDDRGIFRAYGLAPGQYRVSVGQAKPEGAGSALFRRGSQYVQTFYPGVHDEAKAALIEVKEGSEIKDIDIRTSKGSTGFSVTGRVLDSGTNQPVPNVYIGYSPADDSNRSMGNMGFSPSPTDANGKFTIDGLQPGRYAAYMIGITPDNTNYSESVNFEVLDGNVSGVEIKLSQGATINGTAVIENNPDPAISALLGSVSIYAYTERKVNGAPSFARTKINADGTFKLSGLAPGKLRISVQEFPKPPKALRLARIELNGVEQREGFEVAAGAQLNDVRLVFSYGGGTLRGTVTVKNGVLPAGTLFYVTLASGPDRRFPAAVEVDSRGHFSLENIPPGTYEVTLRGSQQQKDVPGFTPLKKTITIIHGQETEVTFEVDLGGN